ncbi:MAG TPA: C10 family peptidase [Ignavibacteriaceae bacterium]|nr:C10 family peptidase [Ignavibacteriaceae bacterium]
MKRLIIKCIEKRGFFLLLTIYLLAVPSSILGKELGQQEVRSAVETWVHFITADARPDAIVEKMEPYTADNEIVAYIAHLSGGGFCICGANDLVLPVYFYSPNGEYDPENPGYQDILLEIKNRSEYLNESIRKGDAQVLQYQQKLSERTLFWQQLISGNVSKKLKKAENALVEPDSMSLLLTCRWDQNSPYNDQCPELTPSEHTLVGCVSTAISQIMYYWKWPKTGSGSHTDASNYAYRWRSNWDSEPLSTNPSIPSGWTNRLQWTANGGGMLLMNGYWEESHYESAKKFSTDSDYLTALDNLYNRLTQASITNSADFGATAYQWDLMQDVHTDPVDAGDAAVATLCYHVAVAVDMSFGVGLSSSDLWRAVDPYNNRKPLVNNFLYDEDAYYGHDNIPSLVTDEIEWLRPVGFSGGPPGHAWVLFGYNKGTDPNRQFKMNMGWGWNYNSSPYGWYTLDNVPQGINQNHGYLIYVAPQDAVRFVGNTTTGDGSPLEPFKNIEDAVGNVSNGTTLIFKAGSDNLFSAPLTINKALTLKGRNVIIRKQ